MKESSASISPVNVYLKGILQSFVLSLILILIMTIVFYFVELNNNLINPLQFIILLLSVVYASLFVSKKMASRGWLHGLLVGVIYFFIFVAINFATVEGFAFLKAIPKMIFFATTGFLGGCIGVNIK